MQEEIAKELEEVNSTLTPVLADILKDIDAKTAAIYFSGLLKGIFSELNDDDFKNIIIRYMADGD